jgi:hypothetical protein
VACHSRFANQRVMVLPWMVRLAWDGRINDNILDGSE